VRLRPAGRSEREARASHVNLRSLERERCSRWTFDVEGAEIGDTAPAARVTEPDHRENDSATKSGQQRADAMVDIFRHYLGLQSRGTNVPTSSSSPDAATDAGGENGFGFVTETIRGYRLTPTTCRRIACKRTSKRIRRETGGVLPIDMGPRPATFNRIRTGRSCARRRVSDAGCLLAGPEGCRASRGHEREDGVSHQHGDGLAFCKWTGHHRDGHTKAAGPSTGDPNGAKSPSPTRRQPAAAPADPAKTHPPSPPNRQTDHPRHRTRPPTRYPAPA